MMSELAATVELLLDHVGKLLEADDPNTPPARR